MAISKRNSRLIAVDGSQYRWAVSPDSGYMILVIEAAEAAGQRLEAQFPYSGDAGPEPLSITPQLVRETIFSALEAGWLPTQKGLSPFKMRSDVW